MRRNYVYSDIYLLFIIYLQSRPQIHLPTPRTNLIIPSTYNMHMHHLFPSSHYLTKFVSCYYQHPWHPYHRIPHLLPLFFRQKLYIAMERGRLTLHTCVSE